MPEKVTGEYNQEIITEQDNNAKQESLAKIPKFKEWINKIKEKSSQIRRELLTLFKKNNIPLLNAPQKQPRIDTNNERKGFQKELRNGKEAPLTVNINISQKAQSTNREISTEKGNEAK